MREEKAKMILELIEKLSKENDELKGIINCLSIYPDVAEKLREENKSIMLSMRSLISIILM